MSESRTPQQLLDSLKSDKLHDLTGLVAVITGGSTVSNALALAYRWLIAAE
jgi:hypothetical protein